MTVETTQTKVFATLNGVATVFSFSPLVIFKSSDLAVTLVDTSGIETVLLEGVGPANYSVSVSPYPGTGSITYPAMGGAAGNGKLVMKRVLTIEQTTDLENQGGYFADTQETALDRLTMTDLQQQEDIDRSFKFPVSDISAPPDLPTATLRAGKVLAFDNSGNPIAGVLSSVAVNAAMVPVVQAASLGAARSLLGVNPLDPAFTNLVYTPAGFTTSVIFVGDGGRNLLHTAGLEGYYNTSLGYQCLTSLTKGSYNTAVGFEAMQTTTTGSYNTGCGEATLIYNITGNGNTSLGWKAKLGVPVGSGGTGAGDYNTQVGYAASINLDIGSNNTVAGAFANSGNAPTGSNNAVFGYAAMSAFTQSSASGNSVFGANSGSAITTGNDNVLMGRNTGNGITTGISNTIVGTGSATLLATGNYNTILGVFTLSAGSTSVVALADGTGKGRFIANPATANVVINASDGVTTLLVLNEGAQAGVVSIHNLTVATLPAAAGVTQGAMAYVTNGRNTGEGVGAGTGCLVTRNSAAVWAAVWSGVAVAA